MAESCGQCECCEAWRDGRTEDRARLSELEQIADALAKDVFSREEHERLKARLREWKSKGQV